MDGVGILHLLWWRSHNLNPPAAHASQSIPAKTAPFLQSGEECTSHMASNLWWNFPSIKSQVTIAGWALSAVILENWLEVHSSVAQWRGGWRVPLCQVLSCGGGSVAFEWSMLLSSILSNEFYCWLIQKKCSVILGALAMSSECSWGKQPNQQKRDDLH
jgi:hypothetical protein